MKIKASEEVREALFEIQVSAFMQGLAAVPSPEDFSLGDSRAHQLCLVQLGHTPAKRDSSEMFARINQIIQIS
jgi:hypothetical protein